MRGILLAGGAGTRLYPTTLITSKQLLPVYNKPMVYYPMCTLLKAGISDILIISTPHDLPSYCDLFGNGNQLGVNIQYAAQDRPGGIAQALTIGADFIGEDSVCLILGDNLFWGGDLDVLLVNSKLDVERGNGARIFGYKVTDPERYGVVEMHGLFPVGIEEKPVLPKSNIAVTGLYMYPPDAVEMVRGLVPSARGELEITDLNLAYLHTDRLWCQVMPDSFAWLDTGTEQAINDAAQFIRIIEERTGQGTGYVEEEAWRAGRITQDQLARLVQQMPASEYQSYLTKLV